MDRSRTMHRIALTALLALSLPLTACVTSGGTCEGSECDAIAEHESPNPVDPHASAVAIRSADLPRFVDPGATDGSSNGTGGGDTAADDSLLIYVGDQEVTCSAPFATTTECGSHWTLSLRLPLALQHSGNYDFAPDPDDAHVLAYESTMEPGDGTTCPSGAGSVTGWVQVTDINSEAVTGYVHADSMDGSSLPVDVAFVAPRCH